MGKLLKLVPLYNEKCSICWWLFVNDDFDLIQTCDAKSIYVTLLPLLKISSNTGGDIFNLIKGEFIKLNVNSKKYIAFSWDNANVMIGQLLLW